MNGRRYQTHPYPGEYSVCECVRVKKRGKGGEKGRERDRWREDSRERKRKNIVMDKERERKGRNHTGRMVEIIPL